MFQNMLQFKVRKTESNNDLETRILSKVRPQQQKRGWKKRADSTQIMIINSSFIFNEVFFPISNVYWCNEISYSYDIHFVRLNSFHCTMCIKDYDKLKLIWRFDFRLYPIFTTAAAASENLAHFKNGQKRPLKIIIEIFTKFQSKSPIHSVSSETKHHTERDRFRLVLFSLYIWYI